MKYNLIFGCQKQNRKYILCRSSENVGFYWFLLKKITVFYINILWTISIVQQVGHLFCRQLI